MFSTAIAHHTRQIGERGYIARGGTTRGRNAQQPPLNASNDRQQDDQLNYQTSTRITTAPSSAQRGRPRHELPDREIDITPAIQPQQAGSRVRKLNEPWADEEVAALDEGLRRHSRRWVVIKADYQDILGNRTNVQLKDKARNIARQRRKDGLPLEHYEGCG